MRTNNTNESQRTLLNNHPIGKLTFAVSAAALFLGAVAPVQAESNFVASVRIGATYEDRADNDGELFIRNFGSRLIWTGSKEVKEGLTGIARLEFGINPDDNSRGNSGVDRTRQLWAGLEGDFGTVKVGAQYAAFYDMVQGNTDIAWWGSCWTQFECSRETRVLKYSGSNDDGLSYSASIESSSDVDDDVEIFDELEGGVNFAVGDLTVGGAIAIHADNENDDGGVLLGGVVKGDFGPATAAVTLQIADEDFANTPELQDDGSFIDPITDTFVNLTFAGTYEDFYLVANLGRSQNAAEETINPFFATLGYTLNLGEGALMYFEAQAIDGDNGGDTDFIGRATYKLDI